MDKTILRIPEQKTPHFFMPAHKVTWKQDTSHLKASFSDQDMPFFLKLYEKTQKSPKKAKKGLEDLLKKHPHQPELLNVLSFIYLSLKKRKKAELLIEKNYFLNPDYLFAKINYADLCLLRNKTGEIPKIFNQALSLKELYPKREVFHISEFRGFMVLMGFYHLSIGDKEKAICYHYLIYKTDPNHPSTKALGKRLYYVPRHRRWYRYIKKVMFKI